MSGPLSCESSMNDPSPVHVSRILRRFEHERRLVAMLLDLLCVDPVREELSARIADLHGRYFSSEISGQNESNRK